MRGFPRGPKHNTDSWFGLIIGSSLRASQLFQEMMDFFTRIGAFRGQICGEIALTEIPYIHHSPKVDVSEKNTDVELDPAEELLLAYGQTMAQAYFFRNSFHPVSSEETIYFDGER